MASNLKTKWETSESDISRDLHTLKALGWNFEYGKGSGWMGRAQRYTVTFNAGPYSTELLVKQALVKLCMRPGSRLY